MTSKTQGPEVLAATISRGSGGSVNSRSAAGRIFPVGWQQIHEQQSSRVFVRGSPEVRGNLLL
jgi:hypothetical protein